MQFKPIHSIEAMESGAQIDVLGIVVHAQPLRRITKKNGDEVEVRNITVKDDSNCSIEVPICFVVFAFMSAHESTGDTVG